jgi:hypothetical protein
MFKKIVAAGLVLASLCSCKMENPLLVESTAPYGAPMFDKIKTEHYLPAFEQAIAEGKAEIDAIVNNPEAPTFENTIEAMEYAGGTLTKVAGIFFNVNEANTSDEMQKVAEEITPMLNDYSMYVSLNIPLFERVKAVYEQKDNLSLEPDQMKLLENAYRNSLQLAVNHGIRTIAFPSISTGVYSYPLAEAAEIAIRTVREFYLAHPDAFHYVRFVLFDGRTLKAYDDTIYKLCVKEK